ncbi:hypothetical protein GF407_00205 [candidate division KSB1 bacterium]|nr:hypothetical protein [candidate division KSB1 bacterium]
MKTSFAFRQRLFLTCLSLLFLIQGVAGQSRWRFIHRLQSGMVYDSNVEESLYHPRAAPALRLMLDTKGLYTSGGRHWNLSYAYNVGGQLYQQPLHENKMIHEASVRTFYHSVFFRIGIKGGLRFKRFFEKRHDYLSGSATPYVVLDLGRGFNLEVCSRLKTLDYRFNDIYDHRKHENMLRLQKRVKQNWSLALRLMHNPVLMRRHAYEYHISRDEWRQKANRQKDLESIVGIEADWYAGGGLFSALYRFETYRSNSDGVAYRRQGMTLLAARSISDFLLRVIVAFQRKRYLDKVFPYLPLDLDREHEENNYFIIDISRDLSRTLSAVLRTAWYSNESPYASLYYEKFEIHTSLEYRF